MSEHSDLARMIEDYYPAATGIADHIDALESDLAALSQKYADETVKALRVVEESQQLAKAHAALQAENERLKIALDHLQQQYDHVHGCLQLSNAGCTRLIRLYDRMREVLRVYADEENWSSYRSVRCRFFGRMVQGVYIDEHGYEPAQQALREVEDESTA